MTPLQALQQLVAYLQDGNAGRSPYSIPEVMDALEVIKRETNFPGDELDANDAALHERRTKRQA